MSFIPTFIRHNPDLSSTAKLLYAEIVATMDENGICTKNNVHFAKAFKCSKGTMSQALTQLREQGYISILIERDEDTGRFKKRYITLRTMFNFSVGVELGLDIPYTDFSVWVEGGTEDFVEEGESSTASKKSNPFIINNKVRYKDTLSLPIEKLNMAITDGQYKYLYGIIESFYQTKHKQFPQLVKKDWDTDEVLINGSINTLYDLIKMDKWDEKVVRNVLRWATEDNFWRNNLISLRTLRKKGSNGQTKFANLFVKYSQ